MKDYKIGRGKPPQATRFKLGNQEWRKREEKRKQKQAQRFSPGLDFRAVLGSMISVKRKGKIVKEFRLQVIVEQLMAKALQGDVDAANDLLSFHMDAETVGDFGGVTTLIFDQPGDGMEGDMVPIDD
ncbi:MAG: DUF5681 domain-containing protein [Anaerolineales bacterium]